MIKPAVFKISLNKHINKKSQIQRPYESKALNPSFLSKLANI